MLGGGIQGTAWPIAKDQQVSVRLEAGGDRPLDLCRVQGIDVEVHDDDVLERAVPLKGRRDREHAVIRAPFVDLDDRVQPVHPSGGETDIVARADLVDCSIDGGLSWQAHQQLVFGQPGQQGLVERLPAVGHAVDLDDRLRPNDVIGLCQVDERPFGDGSLSQPPFQHPLRLGRDQEIVGPAAHQGRGGQCLGDVQFVDPLFRRHRRGQQDVQRQPNADGDGQVVSGRCPRSVRSPVLDQAGCKAPRVQLHQAVDGHVDTVLGIAGDQRSRGHVRPAITRLVREDRQAIQVHRRLDHLLAGRAPDDRRCNGMRQRFREDKEQPVSRHVQREAQVLALCAEIGRDLDVRIAHVSEQDGPIAHGADDPRHLQFAVDWLVDDRQLPTLFQLDEQFPQVHGSLPHSGDDHAPGSGGDERTTDTLRAPWLDQGDHVPPSSSAGQLGASRTLSVGDLDQRFQLWRRDLKLPQKVLVAVHQQPQGRHLSPFDGSLCPVHQHSDLAKDPLAAYRIALPGSAHVRHSRFRQAGDARVGYGQPKGFRGVKGSNGPSLAKDHRLLVGDYCVVDAAGRAVVDLFRLIDNGRDSLRVEWAAQMLAERAHDRRGDGGPAAHAAGYRDGGMDGQLQGMRVHLDPETGQRIAHGEAQRLVSRRALQVNGASDVRCIEGDARTRSRVLDDDLSTHLRHRDGDGGPPVNHGMLAVQDHFARGVASRQVCPSLSSAALKGSVDHRCTAPSFYDGMRFWSTAWTVRPGQDGALRSW